VRLDEHDGRLHGVVGGGILVMDERGSSSLPYLKKNNAVVHNLG
jgi:hypothetical protein